MKEIDFTFNRSPKAMALEVIGEQINILRELQSKSGPDGIDQTSERISDYVKLMIAIS